VKPVLFVTGHVPAYRVGALAALHEREEIEVALFGGRSLHGGPRAAGALPFPHSHAHGAQLARLAGSGHYRAVVCPTGGRASLLATWAGARAGGAALLLWASLWAHPRSAAHALSYLPLQRLYRSADAVVTYGPHVSAYVERQGARNVHVAPQSVDNAFWQAAATTPPAVRDWPGTADCRFLFVGRPAPEKGLAVLLGAWREARASERGAALVLAGGGSRLPPAAAGSLGELQTEGVLSVGALAPEALRDVYAACEVLVVPSIPTPTFREPWGLAVNEAMNRGLAVIASDAVGAAAGGLVRNGENGLVVAAGERGALAAAITRLAGDPQVRAQMGAAGLRDVGGYTHDAWAEGFSRALATVGLSRARW
jgi:glycosyltransferase involved in cell wall biosynthesis